MPQMFFFLHSLLLIGKAEFFHLHPRCTICMSVFMLWHPWIISTVITVISDNIINYTENAPKAPARSICLVCANLKIKLWRYHVYDYSSPGTPTAKGKWPIIHFQPAILWQAMKCASSLRIDCYIDENITPFIPPFSYIIRILTSIWLCCDFRGWLFHPYSQYLGLFTPQRKQQLSLYVLDIYEISELAFDWIIAWHKAASENSKWCSSVSLK